MLLSTTHLCSSRISRADKMNQSAYRDSPTRAAQVLLSAEYPESAPIHERRAQPLHLDNRCSARLLLHARAARRAASDVGGRSKLPAAAAGHHRPSSTARRTCAASSSAPSSHNANSSPPIRLTVSSRRTARASRAPTMPSNWSPTS